MLKRFVCSILLCLVCVANGNTFTGNGTDNLWNTPANWAQGVPAMTRDDGGQWGNMTANGTICVIDTNHIGPNAASAGGVYPGCYGAQNELYMTGGRLDCSFFNIGRGDADSGSDGFFRITGGEIQTQGLKIPNQFSKISGNITGHVDLWGGTIQVSGWFSLGNRQSGSGQGGIGTMDVTEGTLVVNGNLENQIQEYIDDDWITAFGGDGNFVLDYGIRNSGKTTLTALDPRKAHNPIPDDIATSVMEVGVSWTAGANVNSHNVYFGTVNPPPFIRNQVLGETSYDPVTLDSTTTYYWRIDEVIGSETITGELWQFTTGNYPLAALNLTPANGATYVTETQIVWQAGDGADSHDVYFGTTNPPPFVGNQALGNTSYMFNSIDPGTICYWRIDQRNTLGVTAGATWSFTTTPPKFGDLNGDLLVDFGDIQSFVSYWLENGCDGPVWCGGADLTKSTNVDLKDYARLAGIINDTRISPLYTDYCAMLSQEIQGKKHGFLAGNLTYYIGGFMPVWNQNEDETIGFTHPFHHDLRSRGHGMVQDANTGYGHDYSGWEFYKHTKVAYGSVWVGQTKYENPVPTKMWWRPDKMICQYNVGGVIINEEKFIADNDVACTIIISNSPVTLEFAGQSFANDKTITKNATCVFDAANNSVHVTEGGTTEVKPDDGVIAEGVLMYDGMSTVISSSKTITNYTQSDIGGQSFYQFKVPCDSQGVSLVWMMDDDYATAIASKDAVLGDPAGKLAAKTQYMNDILNHQIPYFRCSDQEIVDVYYYLWSLYFMYYIDVDEGFEQYPHTQSAVNNFLGMHRYDACFQIPVGAWVADKEAYANGNVLIWSELLPFANLQTGRIPADNMGIAWYSGLWGGVAPHVVGAWTIYEQSGDLAFLNEAYSFYKALMWQSIPGHWGYQYDAADRLAKMAVELGMPEDADHWYDLVNTDGFDGWLNNMWEKNGVEKYFGGGTGTLGWSGMAYMAMDNFPEDWAEQMTERWAVNESDGFFHFGHISTIAYKDWASQSDVFTFTPDTNWWAIRGMYKHHVGNNANKCTLGHLKNYNLEWGIPVAPESLDINVDLWGDQYSNFNAGKILLILEGICGLKYSIPESTFTVCENMPNTWDSMEMMVPIVIGGQTYWPRVEITRDVDVDGNVEKRIKVTGNPLTVLHVQPFLEELNLNTSSQPGYTASPKGHISYSTTDSTFDVTLELEPETGP